MGALIAAYRIYKVFSLLKPKNLKRVLGMALACLALIFFLLTFLFNPSLSRSPIPETGSLDTPLGISAGPLAEMVIEEAMRHFGLPYHWGGLDCSGLTQRAYGRAGIQLPHKAQLQYFIGFPVTGHLLPADLVFFGKGIEITHVGIYLGEGKFIHASGKRGETYGEFGGKVKISPLDSYCNSSANPTYRGARRLLAYEQ